MTFRAPLRSRRTVRGSSLVEVLVALVVIAVGMLGVAALYVEGLRSGRTALTRTRAIVLATDMSDRIRANLAGADDYIKPATDAGTENTNCDPDGTGCTPTQMARHDIALWNTLVTRLPNGRATIQRSTATTPATYTITITWDEVGGVQVNDGGIGAADSYILRFQA
jgi:type IV pilus assembly protein PilV